MGLLTQFDKKMLDLNLTRTHFLNFCMDSGLFDFGLGTFIFLVNILKHVIFHQKNGVFYIKSTRFTPKTAPGQNQL